MGNPTRMRKAAEPPQDFDPRAIRLAAEWSLDRAAVMARVSYPTAAKYEANRLSVTRDRRERLDALYLKLARRSAA